jgi:acyl transferase domain-containing protein
VIRRRWTSWLPACEADNVRTRRILSTVPGHSPRLEAAREELLEGLVGIEPQASDVPLYSTVSGELATTAAMDAEHWYRNLRQTVRFEPAVRAMAQAGIRTLIEIGPHPVLSAPALEILESVGDPNAVATIGSLRCGEGGLDRFVSSLAEAHVRGVRIDWAPLLAEAEHVPLPTYAFQHRRYWLTPKAGAGDTHALGQAPADHPLLGARVPLADGQGAVWTGRLSLDSHPWLADHAVMGMVVVPGTAFVELALHAAAQTDAHVIEELTLSAPLVLEERSAVAVQVTVSGADEQGRHQGYRVRCLLVRRADRPYRWYQVSPANLVHQPVVLLGGLPVDIYVLAQRVEERPVFASFPQQRRYAEVWEDVPPPDRVAPTLKRRMARLEPLPLKTLRFIFGSTISSRRRALQRVRLRDMPRFIDRDPSEV